jgi:hypothetical protein
MMNNKVDRPEEAQLETAMKKSLFSNIKSAYRNLFLRLRLNSPLTGRSCGLKDIRRSGRVFYRPVTQPFVLISQIQRSGGSLLGQLFDGHPQCFAHPHELKIGPPTGQNAWPAIDLNESPDLIFMKLFESKSVSFLKNGFTKGNHSQTYPFFIIPSLQADIFREYLKSSGLKSARDAFDAYFTAYFNSWLDLQYKYHPDKRVITGFAPGIARKLKNTRNFFNAYPDGLLISLIRDPMSWYASAKRQQGKRRKFGTLESAMDWWKRSSEAMLSNRETYRDRMVILDFDRLVNDTEEVMKYLSGRMGIDFDECLLEPTFNTMPMRANTSFSVDRPGIVKDVLKRKNTLEQSELQYTKQFIPLFEKVLKKTSI